MRLAASFLAAVALTACGNYSDLQVQFIEAVPTASQVHLSIPGASGGQALCSTSTSDALENAQVTGGAFNKGVELVLNLVDLVLTLPPTKHEVGELIWGPAADTSHPGFEDMITMAEVDGGISYDFEMEPKGAATWTPLIVGQFSGGTAASGSGSITLHFENSVALGTNGPSDPTLPVTVSYDLGADPQTIDLNLEASGLQLQTFDYHYQLARDGSGEFIFELLDDGSTVTWTVDFEKDGSGSGSATVGSATGATLSVDESWDAEACVDCLNDPANFTQQPSCAAGAPCTIGDGGSCQVGG